MRRSWLICVVSCTPPHTRIRIRATPCADLPRRLPASLVATRRPRSRACSPTRRLPFCSLPFSSSTIARSSAAAAALDAEADADARRFRSQMEASYKRLRANMSSAYKAERAELRQKHSEHEISALMQRRADKVRTGTLDTSSLEAVERLATASRAAAVAAAAAGGDSQRSALSSTGGSAVAAASTSSAAAAVAVSMNAAVPIDDDDDDDYGDFADFLNSSSSDGEDSDSVATNTTTYDDDDSVSADIDDKPRRARSHQVGTAPVAMKSDRKRGIGTSGERALQRPVSPLVHEAPPVAVAPVVSAAVDWSSDEASEEVVTSMLDELSPGAKGGPPVVPPAPRVESPAPPQPPPPLSEEAEKAKRRLSVTAAVEAASLKPHRKSREKEKSSRKSTSKSTTNKEKTSSSSSSSSKKSKHKEKKDLIVYNPKNDSHSAPKRLGRQVRTIAASATTAPGKLSYTVGEDAVIVEQLSSTWAKARIGDRTGLIKLADVEDVAQGSAATAAAASTTTASTSSSAPSHPAPSAPVPESAKRPSPIITRNRSGSAAYELQRAIAIEQYDAGKHEKAKRDYLKRRARASGVGIDDLAARGTNDASLSTPLFFEAGANILLLSAPEDRPFWQGELDGRIGSFHSSCVRRASTDSPPPPPPPEDSAAAAAAARRSLSKTHGGVISPASASASSTPPQAAAVANLRKKVLRPLSQQAAPAPGSLQSDDESDDASPPPTSIKAVFPKTPPHAAAPSHPLALASTVELGALPGGSGRAMLTKSSPGPRPPLSTTAGTSQARSFPLGSAPAPAAGKVPELKSAPVSPRGGTLESDTGAAAQLGELRACTTALLAAVEQLVKALPDSTIASIPDEIDALAAVCRKTQMRVDMLGASRALTPPLEHGGSLSASTSRVPDDVARRVVFTDDSATATRRSSGSAVPASKKATAGSHLVIGTPVVVPPGSPQLHSSPSRNRRSATAAAGSDVGGTPTKKQGRIGNFLFKFASTKSLDRAIKPTFGLPLRQLVESPVDIPEFVLRGGERLAKLALQEDVLLLGDVDEAQVQALRDVIESGERVDFAAFRAHDIAALLQQFLAELPEPLVSDIGDLLHCHQIDDAEIRDALVQSLLAMLGAVAARAARVSARAAGTLRARLSDEHARELCQRVRERALARADRRQSSPTRASC
jgi:hypothetical protein